jgi:hypothetical protein
MYWKNSVNTQVCWIPPLPEIDLYLFFSDRETINESKDCLFSLFNYKGDLVSEVLKTVSAPEVVKLRSVLDYPGEFEGRLEISVPQDKVDFRFGYISIVYSTDEGFCDAVHSHEQTWTSLEPGEISQGLKFMHFPTGLGFISHLVVFGDGAARKGKIRIITGNKEEIVEAIDIKANGVSRFDLADFLPTDFSNREEIHIAQLESLESNLWGYIYTFKSVDGFKSLSVDHLSGG